MAIVCSVASLVLAPESAMWQLWLAGVACYVGRVAYSVLVVVPTYASELWRVAPGTPQPRYIGSHASIWRAQCDTSAAGLLTVTTVSVVP